MLTRKRTRENIALKMCFHCVVGLYLLVGGLPGVPVSSRVPACGTHPPALCPRASGGGGSVLQDPRAAAGRCR